MASGSKKVAPSLNLAVFCYILHFVYLYFSSYGWKKVKKSKDGN